MEMAAQNSAVTPHPSGTPRGEFRAPEALASKVRTRLLSAAVPPVEPWTPRPTSLEGAEKH